MSRRHRSIKPAYIWGALSNTEPPDDDEGWDELEPMSAREIEPELVTDDAYAAAAAEDRDTAWRDATASQ